MSDQAKSGQGKSDLAKNDLAKNDQGKTQQNDAKEANPASGASADQQKAKAKAARDAAADTAADVRREAGDAASDIAGQARTMAAETSARLRDTVEERKAAGAERAKGIAGAIERAADELEDEIPQAAHYVRQAAKELDHLSDEVRRRDTGELLEVVQDFTRRQPTVVLAAAALAGFAAVRFFMSSSQPGRNASTSFDAAPDRMRTDLATPPPPVNRRGIRTPFLG